METNSTSESKYLIKSATTCVLLIGTKSPPAPSIIKLELEQGANKKLIKDVLVNDKTKWHSKILTKLQTNFKVDLSEIYQYDKLIDINIASINYCREKLGINTPMVLSSSLNITTTRSQRLADICKHFNATEYISGGGGKAYLDESIFDCEISYFHPNVPNYYTTLQHI